MSLSKIKIIINDFDFGIFANWHTSDDMFNTGHSIRSAEMNTDRRKHNLRRGWILNIEGRMGGPGRGVRWEYVFNDIFISGHNITIEWVEYWYRGQDGGTGGRWEYAGHRWTTSGRAFRSKVSPWLMPSVAKSINRPCHRHPCRPDCLVVFVVVKLFSKRLLTCQGQKLQRAG